MIAMRRAPMGVLAVLLLVIALALAIPLTAAKGGSSENAKQCQKGGWEQLATTAAPTVGFTNEKECFSAAARGATLTPRIETYVAMYRTLSDFTFMGRLLCELNFALVNPVPVFTSVTVTSTLQDGTVLEVESADGLSFPGPTMIFANEPLTDIGALAHPGDVALPVIVAQNTCVVP